MPETVPTPVSSGLTHHLVPADVWAAQRGRDRYEPESFAAEGFVHCTDGLDKLLVPANTYYRGDPRAHLALTIDLARVGSRTQYDDEARIYPHVYGPIATASVVEVRRALRDPDGTFTGWSDPE